MPQRVLLAHAFALPIGLFALLFSQASCSSRAQGTLPQLTVLQSTRSFRLNTNLPRLEDAAVGSNGNLYFLMSEKGQHFEVIRVDDSGNTIQSVVVPPVNSAFRKIVAGPNGKLAVLLQQGSHSPDTIQVVDGDTGQLLNTISSSEKVSELCFLGPQLVGVASATSRLLIIRLFQQATTGSMNECLGRDFEIARNSVES